MARKANPETLIHCDACGEDYSATYKRCPFCGEQSDAPAPAPRPQAQSQSDYDDGYVFEGQDIFDREDEPARAPSKGGKRLAGNAGRRSAPAASSPRGGDGPKRGTPPPPVNWPRLITFLCSLVIIAAALVIVFTVLYPKLHKDPAPAGSQEVTTSQQPSSEVPSALPSDDPENSDEPDPSQDVTAQPSQGVSGLTEITLDTYDFTLQAGKSHTLKATFQPSDWEGTVTWSSSDESCATVDANGKVVNVNTTGNMRRVTITASAGGVSVECVVYCVGTSSSDPSPSPSTGGSSSGSLTPGATGTIVNASGGLRVRSGPGTTYEVLATITNGSQVTIVSNAGGGWYEITYAGAGGVATKGYIMGEYISVS